MKIMEFLLNSSKDFALNEKLNIRVFYQKRENVMIVPTSAVLKKKIKNKQRNFIYFISNENKITEKEIQVGISNGEIIEIYGEKNYIGKEIILNPDEKLYSNVIVERKTSEDERKIIIN